MTPLFKTLESIKTDPSLARPRTLALFTEARARIAALAPYEAPRDVLAALLSKSRLEYTERHDLITALVGENQRAPRPFWQSLLLVAFDALLLRLRVKIGNPRSTDLDQQLLLAFLNSLRSVCAGSYTALAIRWATEGEIFSSLRAEHRRPDRVTGETPEFDDDTYCADVFGVTEEEKAAGLELARIIEAQGGDELLDVIVSTKANEESLRDYVARKHPHVSEEIRAKEYGRLRRARDRLLRKLQARVKRTALSSRTFAA